MSGTVSCQSCGREVQRGDRFCPGCGSTVVEPADTRSGPTEQDLGSNPTQCVNCGAAMGRDDRFCPKCGTSRPEDATVVSHVSLRNTQAAHLIEATEGEFEIIQELGSGAMGAVYLARDVALSRQVAIKVIAPHLLSDETMISRFRLEAQTVASLRHPNIVNVHAVKQSDDLHYFVMEFIDGPPLRSIVKSHAPLDIGVVQGLLFPVGSALSYAHRKGGGVIHRDIKPANIMVDRDGNAFVTDFGISKIAEAKTGLTQTGATIGTPEYMSPEQCRGETLTGASDQYALGVVAYEMLCGHTPFSGSQYYIMVAHTNEAPRPIREIRPDCPPDVAEAVERMLAKAPEDRWPDLDAAVHAIGGAPLSYQDPTRTRIVALTSSTLTQIPAVPSTSPSGGGPVTADTATKVSVTGLPPVIEVGDSFTLEADIQGTGGVSLSGLGVVWASTDPSIAKVDGGVVEAIQSGSVSITATAGNVANSVLLTVAEPAPAEVLVSPGSVTIQEGGRIALSALVQDRRGRRLEQEVSWLSSDPAVATVTDQGQVVAIASGPVTVTAKCGGASGTAQVVVEAPVVDEPPAEEEVVASAAGPAATVIVPASLQDVPAGEADASPYAAPAAEPAAPRAKPPPPRPRYEEADSAVPLYRRPGVIAASIVALLGVGYGVMSIAGGGDTEVIPPDPPPIGAGAGAVADPVSDAVVEGPAADPDPITDPAGGQPDQPASAQPEPDQPASAQPEPDQPASAQPEPDQPVDQPDPDPVEPEPAVQDNPPDVVVDAQPPPPPAPTPGGVVVLLERTSMADGDTQPANAVVTSTAGTQMADGQYSLSWESRDPGVIGVNAQTGLVTATGAGTAYLVASTAGVRDSVAVTVEAAVASVEIGDSDLTIQAGQARGLTVTVAGSDGQPMQQPVTWSSDNPGVATVDAGSGQLSAVSIGSAEITASASGFEDRITVTVEAALPSADAARPAVDAFVTVLNGGSEDAIRAYWSAGDENGRDDVVDLVGERNFAATLGQVSAPVLEGEVIRVSFDVATSYRTFAGSNRERTLSLGAELRPAGSGWLLASLVLR